jgi:hypothetical protein
MPTNNGNAALNESSTFINQLYDGLTYYDLYGSSIFLVCFVTFFVFLVCSYCSIMAKGELIKKDWLNQRCKPTVLPFAGILNAPEGTTATEYAGKNFAYCVQELSKSVTKIATDPITMITAALVAIFEELRESVNKIKTMLSNLRTRITKIITELINRILAVVVPVQVLVIHFRSLLMKASGIMATGMYTIMGLYTTFQSLLGAILEGIIKVLTIYLGYIIALWITPFGWGAAAMHSAIFTAIAVPTGLIAAMTNKVMDMQVGKIPKLKCFDPNTLFEMHDGSFKEIWKLRLGDMLANNNRVTARIKVDSAGVNMYNLYGTIVSETHMVKHVDKWIRARDHPDAILIKNYGPPDLYCLNTSQKVIQLNGTLFTDWDEIYDETLDALLEKNIKNSALGIDVKIEKEENIHKFLERGFSGATLVELNDGTRLPIHKVKVGDRLIGGEEVYGIVEIDASTMHKIYNYYLEDSVNICGGMNLNYSRSSGTKVMSTLENNGCFAMGSSATDALSKVYHLLTDTGKFQIYGLTFYDYNYGIDCPPIF